MSPEPSTRRYNPGTGPAVQFPRSPPKIRRGAANRETPMSHQELARSYPAHLAEVSRRTADALARSRLDAVILHAGEPIGLFLDDQHYPFKVHPPFKWWAPLLDAPGSMILFRAGSRPKLIFHVEADFWYQPAKLPESWWPAHFEIIEVHSKQESRAALPKDLSKTAWIGDPLPELIGWGVASINPPDLMRRLENSPRRLGVRHSSSLCCRLRPTRAGAALQRDRRAERGRVRASLPGAAA